MQKLEAIGTLAASIAHDFNNILTVVLGYAGILTTRIGQDDTAASYVDRITSTCRRGSHLTQSLLTFSRKLSSHPKSLKLKATVEGIGKSMARLLGEQICLETVLCREDLMIMADYGQLEHILMNLCTNAKDAMPEGGILSLQTERVELGDDFITRHGYGCPSVYARISVIDTGVGIDKETRERIFEPFFTTKEAGKGTGLGLSIVYGLVKQHNGYINVYSQIGAGTVFNIYLPAIDRGIDEGRVLPLKRSQASHETILIARDDEPEGSLIGEVLRE